MAKLIRCNSCGRHYKLPQDHTYSLICTGCGMEFIIAKLVWQPIKDIGLVI